MGRALPIEYGRLMLTPVLVLIGWTLVMWVWLYATRLPAMARHGVDPRKIRQKSELDVLPAEVRRVADNYNHLHEQPTLFYALMFYCHLAGVVDGFAVALAWIYVLSRIAHSLIQSMWNYVPARFSAFAIGTLALMVLVLRCFIALF